jgi:hypothetical protein
MEHEHFQACLSAWQAMPGNLEDVTYLAQRYPSPLDARLDSVCALYLEASAEQQKLLADVFASERSSVSDRFPSTARSDTLLGYIRRVARRITSGKDGSLAQLGLAAAALAAGEADERDILMACAFLAAAALRAGIDFRQLLEAMPVPAQPQAQRVLSALRKSDDATLMRVVRYHEGTG